jgi:hypothetical protein
MSDTTSTAALSSSSNCRVEGCDSPVHATELCSKHKRQELRQRSAFIKTRPGKEWCQSYFVADVKVKRGRNPKPSLVSLDVAAVTHGYDQHGNLTRLDKKAKTKHLPKEGDSAADVRSGKKWEANWRKNATTEFKSVHWAERDRAMFLGKTVPRTAHVPTIPLTRNPAGWGRSPWPTQVGAFAHVETVETSMGSYERMSGYRITPTGLSKPCTCKACKASRKSRVPQA